MQTLPQNPWLYQSPFTDNSISEYAMINSFGLKHPLSPPNTQTPVQRQIEIPPNLWIVPEPPPPPFPHYPFKHSIHAESVGICVHASPDNGHYLGILMPPDESLAVSQSRTMAEQLPWKGIPFRCPWTGPCLNGLLWKSQPMGLK